MSEIIPEELETELNQYLGDALPGRVLNDIHQALELADILETRGFSFKLRDLYPKSMFETGWRAIFEKDGRKFIADSPESPVAVCLAAADALAGRHR